LINELAMMSAVFSKLLEALTSTTKVASRVGQWRKAGPLRAKRMSVQHR